MRPRVNSARNTDPEVIDLLSSDEDDGAPLARNIVFGNNTELVLPTSVVTDQQLRIIKQDPADGEEILYTNSDSDHESLPPILFNQLLIPLPETSPPERMPPLNIQQLIASAPGPFIPPAKKQRKKRTTLSSSQIEALQKSFVSNGGEIPITGLLRLAETTKLPILKIKVSNET
jgi:hypothetical protein